MLRGQIHAGRAFFKPDRRLTDFKLGHHKIGIDLVLNNNMLASTLQTA